MEVVVGGMMGGGTKFENVTEVLTPLDVSEDDESKLFTETAPVATVVVAGLILTVDTVLEELHVIAARVAEACAPAIGIVIIAVGARREPMVSVSRIPT
jgi:hypothetical protein